MDLETEIGSISSDDLWKNYALMRRELKQRGLIRTGNITGERGEQIVIQHYNSTPNEPNLQAAPEGTRNIDAISRKGERYSIKTITFPGKTTGVFYGLNLPGSIDAEEKKFEYLIVVLLDDLYQPIKIVECTWETFLKHKRWHKTMNAWNVSITNGFIEDCRLVFSRS